MCQCNGTSIDNFQCVVCESEHTHCMSVCEVVCMFTYSSVVMVPLVKSVLVFVILLDVAMQLLLAVILFWGVFMLWVAMQLLGENMQCCRDIARGEYGRVVMTLLGENMQELS